MSAEAADNNTISVDFACALASGSESDLWLKEYCSLDLEIRERNTRKIGTTWVLSLWIQ